MLTEATQMTAQITSQMFVVPVVGTAVGAVLYAGWIGPWDARRTLRSRVRAISLQVRSDQDDHLLPNGAERVELFREILQFVDDDPTRWQARLLQRPAVDDPGSVLTGLARARLDRYVQRLERALARYRRRVWFTGARIALDVDDLLTDSRIPQFEAPVAPVEPWTTDGGTVLPGRGEGGPDPAALTPVGWTSGALDVRDRSPLPLAGANHPPG